MRAEASRVHESLQALYGVPGRAPQWLFRGTSGAGRGGRAHSRILFFGSVYFRDGASIFSEPRWRIPMEPAVCAYGAMLVFIVLIR